MKKILITGSTGQLGNSLGKVFKSRYDLVFTSRTKPNKNTNYFLDITNLLLVKDMVSAISPDIIINLAALTNVDLCESNPDLAHAINFQGVKNLVNVYKGPIIHLSTDYVFDGKLGQYKENDITNPINVYGVTKYKAEKILLEKSKESLVIRTNVLYDYQSKAKSSFLNWVVDSLKRGAKIKVVDDQFNNPTWTDSISVVIDRAIKADLNGLIHWGDFDWISRYDFANKIADKFNLQSHLIEPIKTYELNQVAPRPLNGGLDTTLAQNLLRLEPPQIDDCLNQIIENLK
ncbi:MAG: dTDP-4-dehydrorhamnose reductase [Candidatus Neomarinimicrobiota bacterium]